MKKAFILLKKAFILIAFLLAGATLNAQTTPLNEAVDFTATDCHGEEIHLFDILDRGQAVLIDFFFYTCSGCRQIEPYIAGAYSEMGCNQHDVFFMEISDIDNNQMCQRWIDEFNVQYPTIGVEGGGAQIFNQYGITACPTVILIMPDRSIPIKGYPPMYPFSVQEVVTLLQQYGGLEPHECMDAVLETVESQTITVYPNPANSTVTICGENLGTVSVYNPMGQKIDEFQAVSEQLVIPTDQYPNGMFFVKTGSGATQRFVVSHN